MDYGYVPMMDPVTDLPMTKCPVCDHDHVSGPEYRRGNWGNRYYGWLVYWCTRCKFEQKVPTKEDRAKEQNKFMAGGSSYP